YPLLVCNRASLTELNARMPEPIPMNRFRPNFVLDGLEPFAEDTIDSIAIGEVVLRLVKPCTRCVTTATDQRTGERSTNPLPVLRKFRFDRKLLGVTFGENAVVERGAGASIRLGAECRV
ncbi:MAG: MOSC domain-containing protein, partial [Steroidobacteraceae bacterium]